MHKVCRKERLTANNGTGEEGQKGRHPSSNVAWPVRDRIQTEKVERVRPGFPACEAQEGIMGTGEPRRKGRF